MQHILNRLMTLRELVTKDYEWLVEMETPLLVRVDVGSLGLVVRDGDTQLTQLHIGHINVDTTIPCAFHNILEHRGLTNPRLAHQVEGSTLTHTNNHILGFF